MLPRDLLLEECQAVLSREGLQASEHENDSNPEAGLSPILPRSEVGEQTHNESLDKRDDSALCFALGSSTCHGLADVAAHFRDCDVLGAISNALDYFNGFARLHFKPN